MGCGLARGLSGEVWSDKGSIVCAWGLSEGCGLVSPFPGCK